MPPRSRARSPGKQQQERQQGAAAVERGSTEEFWEREVRLEMV